MKYFIIILSALLASVTPPASSAAEEITLLTANTAPFVVKNETGAFEGFFYDRVVCVLDKIDQPYKIDIVPWMRAQMQVEKSQANGFFPASKSEERDKYATLTNSLVRGNFYIYYRNDAPLTPEDPSFKHKAKVAAFWGSARYRELEAEGYHLGPKAHTFEALFDMTDHGRVDAVLLSGVMAQNLLKKRGRLKEYKRYFHSSRPMGVYVSNEFLEKNSTFLSAFNQQISPCAREHPID